MADEHGVIGEAFIGIAPDVANFESSLNKAVTTALKNLGNLKVDMPGVTQAVQAAIERALNQVRWNPALGASGRGGAGRWQYEAGAGAQREGGARMVSLSNLIRDEIVRGVGALTSGVPLEGEAAKAAGSAAEQVARKVPAAVGPALERAVEPFRSRLEGVVGGVGGLVASSVERSGSAIRNALTSSLSGATLGAGLLTGIVASLGGLRELIRGLSLGSQLEGSRAALTQLSGSADLANEAITTLHKTSALTGQAFQPLADGAKQLVAVLGPGSTGTATAALSAVADYITVFTHGTGSSAQQIQRATLALQEIGLTGVVQAKHLRQLVNDGVPAYKILVEAAQKAGIQLNQNDAAFVTAANSQDQVTKSTLALQTAQQHQNEALARYGPNSSQYANAVRAVQSAQLSVDDATRRATAAMDKADQSTGSIAQALKAGKISATEFFAALADPAALKQVQGVLNSLGDNLVFSLNRVKSSLAIAAAQLFEPIQKPLAAAVSGITGPLYTLVSTGTGLNTPLGKLGQQLAAVIPLGPLKAAGDAVGGLITRLSNLGSGAVTSALDRLGPYVPVIAGLAGGVAAAALSFGSALPFLGAFLPAVNPVLGVLAGIALVTPQVREGLLGAVRTLAPVGDAIGRLVSGALLTATDVLSRLTAGLQPFVRDLAGPVSLLLSITSGVLDRLISLLGTGLLGLLRELGSAAATLGPPLTSLLLQAGGLIESIGRALGPTVLNLLHGLVDTAAAVGQAVAGVLGRIRPDVEALSGPLLQLSHALTTYLLPLLPQLVELLGRTLDALLPLVGPLVQLAAEVIPPLAAGLKAILDVLGPLAPALILTAIGFKGLLIAEQAAVAVQALALALTECYIREGLFVTVARVANLELLAGGAVRAATAGYELLAGAIRAVNVELIAQRIAALASAAAEGVATAATWALAAATAVLDAEFWLSPIGLITAAVIALAVAAVLLYLNWDKVTAAFRGVNDELTKLWAIFQQDPGYWLGRLTAALLLWPEALGVQIGLALYRAGAVVGGWMDDEAARLGRWALGLPAAIGQAVSGIDDQLARFLASAPGIIAQATNAIDDRINGFLRTLVEALWSSLDAFGAWEVQLVERMFKAGEDAMLAQGRGLISGAQKLLAQAPHFFGRFFAGLIGEAYTAGQGGSPMMLFAPPGEDVVNGIVVGLQRRTGVARDAMGRLVTELVPGARDVSLGAALPALAGASVGGGQGSGPIALTVNVSQPNASPDQIARAIGDELARMGVTS